MNAIIKKVGVDKVFHPKLKRNRYLKYCDIEYDSEGWADASLYLPLDFDLVYIKSKEKIYVGWAYGKKWDGIKLNNKDKILFWKRKLDV